MRYSVVNHRYAKSIADHRIDAECYQSEYLQAERLILDIENKTIGELSESVINFGAYSLCNFIEFLDSGIPFIVTEDIYDNIIDDTHLHFISQEVHKLLYKSHCRPGQVLLTMAGAYLGQAAVYNLDFTASSNQAIAKISIQANDINPYYLSTFLNSKYGQSQINRFKTGTGQPNLNLGLIKTLRIPLFSSGFQGLIEEIVSEAQAKILLSKNLYEHAEGLLLDRLNLLDWQPNKKSYFITSFSETNQVGRIDAHYFQPQYQELLSLIRESQNGYTPLGDLVTINKSIEPGTNAYRETGVPFVRVSNLSKYGINSNNQQFVSEKFYEDFIRYQPQKGEILLSKDATPGIAYLLSKESKQFIPSGGILRLGIKKDNIKPEYLTLVLNSLIVQKQIERDAGGSIISHWRPDQIRDVLIPLLSFDEQIEIAELLRESSEARDSSISLRATARAGTEIAIEQDEASAQQWIRSQN